jgi:hypothetical protein
MVGRKSEQNRLMRWCVSVFKYARDNHPQMRFHGWGINHPLLVRNLPWYSVDSSGWGSAYRYGRISLWDSRKGRELHIPLDGTTPYQYSSTIRAYGVDPSEILKSHGGNRALLVRMAAQSKQYVEDSLRKRVVVTAPTYGITGPVDDGPNLHVVDGNASILANLNSPPGPHFHLADTDMGNLATLRKAQPEHYETPTGS